MKKLIVAIVWLAVTMSAAAQIAGSWEGRLVLNAGMSLRLVLHLKADGSATLDSPDQGAYGIPLTVNCNTGDSISVAAAPLQMTYEGRLTPSGAIDGTFHQGMLNLPLNFSQAAEARRPQTPMAPFPYAIRPVTVDCADGAVLAGELMIPNTPVAGKPALLMVSGSGQQDRDESAFDHKPFLVIADALARKGIATLRLDDRGVGGSTGLTDTLTTAGNIADARAALAALRSSGDWGSVGVLGHSEGGRIAFALDADFIVALGAPAVRGDSLIVDQQIAVMTLQGMPENQARSMARVPSPAPNVWYAWFFSDDPSADIAAVRKPTLAIYGEKDCQVRPALNVPAVKRLNAGIEVRVLDGLNHLLQPCATGAPGEYGQIETTIAPEVLNLIADWIMALNPLPE